MFALTKFQATCRTSGLGNKFTQKHFRIESRKALMKM